LKNLITVIGITIVSFLLASPFLEAMEEAEEKDDD
jgi:hypothetical protein